MSDKKTAFQLRMSTDAKAKVEYLAEQSNRSINGMILEMIESYSITGSSNSNFKGMTKEEYSRYLLSGLVDGGVNIFDFEISTASSSYIHDKQLKISEACSIGEDSGCYALVDGGEILYIGASKNLKSRMHARKSNGWIASGSLNRGELDYGMKLSSYAKVMFWYCDNYRDMERDLIYSLSPKFNANTPSHNGKSDYVIMTDYMRKILMTRSNDELTPPKERKSIDKLLSMRSYK
jgi:hypothetical protein